MIWFWAILAAVAIGVVVRLLAHLHDSVLKMQQKYQTTFFELADKIVDRDDVTEEQLSILAALSANLRSRKMQLIVMAAIQKAEKAEKDQKAEKDKSVTEVSEFRKSMHPEMRLLWNKMYFRWLVAVTTQGSITGLAGLSKLLAYFGPDEPDNFAGDMPYLPHARPAGAH